MQIYTDIIIGDLWEAILSFSFLQMPTVGFLFPVQELHQELHQETTCEAKKRQFLCTLNYFLSLCHLRMPNICNYLLWYLLAMTVSLPERHACNKNSRQSTCQYFLVLIHCPWVLQILQAKLCSLYNTEYIYESHELNFVIVHKHRNTKIIGCYMYTYSLCNFIHGRIHWDKRKCDPCSKKSNAYS